MHGIHIKVHEMVNISLVIKFLKEKNPIKINLLKDERLKFLDAGSITHSEIMCLENIFILRVYSVMLCDFEVLKKKT